MNFKFSLEIENNRWKTDIRKSKEVAARFLILIESICKNFVVVFIVFYFEDVLYPSFLIDLITKNHFMNFLPFLNRVLKSVFSISVALCWFQIVIMWLQFAFRLYWTIISFELDLSWKFKNLVICKFSLLHNNSPRLNSKMKCKETLFMFCI
jgi:flagellar biosynthesis protein FlhB